MVRKRRGLILGVFSAKGGVGKTTTVANLGASLAQELEDRVLIVETNMSASNLGLHLGVLEQPVVMQDVAMGKVGVEEAISTTDYGLHFIPGSVSFQSDLGEIDLGGILDPLREEYDILLVDSAPGFAVEVTVGMRASDELLIIAQPRVPAIAGTLQTFRKARRMKIPIFGVVLNHVKDKRFELPVSEIKRTLGWPTMVEVPDDDAVPQSIHNGVPVVLDAPNSPAAREFRKLASAVLRHEKERRKVTPRRKEEREEELTPLMRRYEDETGRPALWSGEPTKQYRRWRRKQRRS